MLGFSTRASGAVWPIISPTAPPRTYSDQYVTVQTDRQTLQLGTEVLCFQPTHPYRRSPTAPPRTYYDQCVTVRARSRLRASVRAL